MPVTGAPCWSLITLTVMPVVLLLTATSPSLPPDRIIRPTRSTSSTYLTACIDILAAIIFCLTVSDCVQTVSCSNIRPGLRSSDISAYAKPRCRTRFEERGFCYAGPTAWNSLPDHLHQISNTNHFKHRLKTELFRRAYLR